ncbi:MAG: hypothetical protein WA890_05795 [Micromonospora sp.]
MTRRLAELLLRTAIRRWPAGLRDDLRREWAAELHVLAERRARLRMLHFVGSLATSRAATALVDRTVFHRQLRRTAGALLLAPPVCVGAVAFAAVLTGLAYGRIATTVSWAAAIQLPLWSVLTIGFGVLLAVLAGRWAARALRTGPLATALGVVLPLGLTALLVAYGLDDGPGLARRVPGLLLWLAGLTLALWAATTLARRGRRRLAWTVGILAALVAADVAVVLTVLAGIPATDPGPLVDGVPPDAVDRVSAPLWLFTCWADSSFGLPRPTPWERFLITDRVLVEAYFYLACTPYALAYAIRVAGPETPPPLDVASAEPLPSRA